MAKPPIDPQTLKGFRDFLPSAAMAREKVMETARRVYRSYGFSPIDTPALEYAEVLLRKGGDESDKQLFRFTDQGQRDVAMRFDLTVPFARFAAQHFNEIGVPFKRYHLGTVWRGENTQRGRYREFMQCDFDTIGTESNTADIETLFVIHDLLCAIGFERFQVRVNNRLLLNGLLAAQGLSEHAVGVLRALDKLAKIGPEKVIDEMVERVGATREQATRVLEFASLKGSTEEILTTVRPWVAGQPAGEQGVERLSQLFQATARAGIPVERVSLDLSIARGLDYYTGTIYETILQDDPAIGSICSGGRYDNLAALFTNQKLPGVGASLGLDRLLTAMEAFGMIATASTPAPVLVLNLQADRQADYLRIGRFLRQAGLSTEVFPDAVQLGKQFKYAERKGFQVAVIAGETELDKGVWQVKHLTTRSQTEVSESDLAATLRSLLTGQ